MRKKTEYYITAFSSVPRRVWEDEKGMYIMFRGERCEVDKEHYGFFLKHQDSLKVATKEE